MSVKSQSRNDGLTDEERKVMDAAVICWRSYLKIAKDKDNHPDDLDEFRRAIHVIQNILMCRIVRREYPDEYTTIKDTN